MWKITPNLGAIAKGEKWFIISSAADRQGGRRRWGPIAYFVYEEFKWENKDQRNESEFVPIGQHVWGSDWHQYKQISEQLENARTSFCSFQKHLNGLVCYEELVKIQFLWERNRNLVC